MARDRRLPPGEFANALSHGIGLALSVIGAIALIIFAVWHGDIWRVVGCSIFAVTLVAVYTASTLSHSFSSPQRRQLFRAIDQASIYLLIAGTYTPFALAFLRFGWWWFLLALMWSIALYGFISKMVFARRVEQVAVWPYVLLGWLPAVPTIWLVKLVPGVALWWMLVGGLFYTVGTLFLIFGDRRIHYHTIWHVFVLGGSACHFFAILFFVADARVVVVA